MEYLFYKSLPYLPVIKSAFSKGRKEVYRPIITFCTVLADEYFLIKSTRIEAFQATTFSSPRAGGDWMIKSELSLKPPKIALRQNGPLQFRDLKFRINSNAAKRYDFTFTFPEFLQFSFTRYIVFEGYISVYPAFESWQKSAAKYN